MSGEGPPDDNITFVVQGAVQGASTGEGVPTAETLASIRRHFPTSRIVLSTWEGEDTWECVADEVITSVDPGPILGGRAGEITNNINRQIVSTYRGLERVRTLWAVKMRSDARITGRGFIGLAAGFPWRHPKARLFEERVVVIREFTRSARSYVPMPFHPSDLFQFGLTQDLRLFWSGDLIEGERLDEYRLPSRPGTWFRMLDDFRYTAEQYLLLRALETGGMGDLAATFTHFAALDAKIAAQSDHVLFNNFIPCESAVAGVEHPKFARRSYRTLREDCVGARAFLSWYLAHVTGAPVELVLGPAAPSLSALLKAERAVREVAKRSGRLRAFYARHFIRR